MFRIVSQIMFHVVSHYVSHCFTFVARCFTLHVLYRTWAMTLQWWCASNVIVSHYMCLWLFHITCVSHCFTLHVWFTLPAHHHYNVMTHVLYKRHDSCFFTLPAHHHYNVMTHVLYKRHDSCFFTLLAHHHYNVTLLLQYTGKKIKKIKKIGFHVLCIAEPG